jgi:hypothetical protein
MVVPSVIRCPNPLFHEYRAIYLAIVSIGPCKEASLCLCSSLLFPAPFLNFTLPTNTSTPPVPHIDTLLPLNDASSTGVCGFLVKGSDYESFYGDSLCLGATHLAFPCSGALARPLIRDGCLEMPQGLHPLPAGTDLKRC